MPSHGRIRLLLVGAVLLMAATVWIAADRERAASDGLTAEGDAADSMLIAIQDQSNGLAGYASTRQQLFLKRFDDGRRKFDIALLRARAGADADQRPALARQRRTAREWQRLADLLVDALRARRQPSLGASYPRRLDAAMMRFRRANLELKRTIEAERRETRDTAVMVTVGLIVLLGALFGGLGYLVFERRIRRDQLRGEQHARFVETLQLARSEGEAHAIVKRYLERVVGHGTATVLNRNNSANRLEAITALEDADLQQALIGVEPEACIAIRGGRTYSSGLPESDLIRCEICGATSENATCVPSLVGGEVIGSVLLQHDKPLPAGDVAHIASSIAEAAPVLANMRNLAVAEFRAATDGLTDLPNRRSVGESLKLMIAQSARTGSPLAVLLCDLDHFKDVNDRHGHGKGDAVLAAVGDALAAGVRASDVVGRYGGEEFLALLPATDRGGAVDTAEKLRAAIEALNVKGVLRRVTVSIGVAVHPDDAVGADELLRVADRALYQAKADGRNRVAVAASSGPNSLSPDVAETRAARDI